MVNILINNWFIWTTNNNGRAEQDLERDVKYQDKFQKDQSDENLQELKQTKRW